MTHANFGVLAPAVRRLIIIGGGVAGLAAARRAAQRLPGAAVTLIERDPRLGGKVLTERVDGFVIEAGPDTFLARKPRGLDLCRELGLGPRVQATLPQRRRSFVLRAGRLHPLPEGLSGLVPARLGPLARSGLLSPAGQLRAALDYLLPPRPGQDDESVAAFVERRLGREVWERLVEPLLSGIYAGDGAQLSLAATFPQLRQAEREHGSLLRGVHAASRKAPPPVAETPFVSIAGGLAELVEALAAGLAGVDVRLGVGVARLASQPHGYTVTLDTGEALPTEAVILATPAFASALLLARLDPALAATLNSILYASTATVSLAYREADLPRPLDGYGYLIPRAEGRPVLACTFSSSKLAGRAPAGYALLRGFVGRAGQPAVLDRPDEELVALVRDELRRTLSIAAAPQLQRVYRWPRALPQYTLGHGQRLAAVAERLAAHPGLYLSGSAYHGVGLPDCLASGEQAAEAAAQHLAALHSQKEAA